jgi:DUF4097 and DUF4098 domain-containing protein YvlB
VVGSAGRRVDVVTASGEVRVGNVAGAVDVKTASGNVVLGGVAGDVAVRTASGRVAVSRFDGIHFEVKTVSGSVRVGLPSGRRYSLLLQTLSGDVRTDFPVSGEVGAGSSRIAIASVSGDIHISAAGQG